MDREATPEEFDELCPQETGFRPCPYIKTGNEGTAYCELAESSVKTLAGRNAELEARLATAEARVSEARERYHAAANHYQASLSTAENRAEKAEARLKYHEDNFIRLTDERADAIRRAEMADARNALLFKEKADAIALIAEIEARLQNAITLNDAMNERSAGLLEAYEEVVEGNRALLQRAEKAEARAEAAEKELGDVRHSFHRAKQVRETYRQELLRAQAALEQVEWMPTYDGRTSCPWCDRFQDGGHRSDCARQAALLWLDFRLRRMEMPGTTIIENFQDEEARRQSVTSNNS